MTLRMKSTERSSRLRRLLMNLEIPLMICLLIIKNSPFHITQLPASLLSFHQEPLIEGLGILKNEIFATTLFLLEFRLNQHLSSLFSNILPVLLLNVLVFLRSLNLEFKGKNFGRYLLLRMSKIYISIVCCLF